MTTGTYIWQGQIYTGQAAVAQAAGVNQGVVSWHLNRHGHLDNLGAGERNAQWPRDAQGTRRRPVSKFGREWSSLSDFARDLGIPLTTAKTWLDSGEDDRLREAMARMAE